MACKKGGDNPVYLARIAARNCEGEYTNICCVDNVLLNFDNTERIRQKTQDGCVVKDVRKLTASISYDFYSIKNAEVLGLMFPNGTLEQVAGATVTGATQTLYDGTFASDDLEDKKYLIENRNDDNTVISITSVVGSVDGTLVSGVDYDVELQELCNADGSKYGASFIVLKAHGGFGNNLTTDAQDLVITYDYTPRASYKFKVSTGSYASSTIDIVLRAVNKQDPTDFMEVKAEASFSISGGILQFSDTDGEINGISATLEIEEDTEIEITGLKLDNQCADKCS